MTVPNYSNQLSLLTGLEVTGGLLLAPVAASCSLTRSRRLFPLHTKKPWDFPTPLPGWGEVRAPDFDPPLERLKSFHLGRALGVLRPPSTVWSWPPACTFCSEERGLVCTAWFRSNKVRASLQVKSTLYPRMEMCLRQRFWRKALKVK